MSYGVWLNDLLLINSVAVFCKCIVMFCLLEGCLGVLGCLVCLVVAWRCFCFDFDVYLLISFVCLFICFVFVWDCV